MFEFSLGDLNNDEDLVRDIRPIALLGLKLGSVPVVLIPFSTTYSSVSRLTTSPSSKSCSWNF